MTDMTTSQIAAILAPLFAAVPWIVLLVSVVRRIHAGTRIQTWQIETTFIGALSALATFLWADHAIGWIGYGTALLAHGPKSIGSRIGTAYERLVAMPGGDAHAVECLGVQRFYTWGVTAMTAAGAALFGAWLAVVQLAMSDLFSRWRRRYVQAAAGAAPLPWARLLRRRRRAAR